MAGADRNRPEAEAESDVVMSGHLVRCPPKRGRSDEPEQVHSGGVVFRFEAGVGGGGTRAVEVAVDRRQPVLRIQMEPGFSVASALGTSSGCSCQSQEENSRIS